MQLSDHSGIRCDHCGTAYRNQFTYYSLDFKVVQVVGGLLPPDRHDLPDASSLDFCGKCMKELAAIVVQNYRAVEAGVICDLTGQHLTGDFSYYHCVITKADVVISHACATCRANLAGSICAAHPETPPLRRPQVATTPRYLEVAISEAAHEQLLLRAGELRAIAAQWSSTSGE